MLISQNWLKKYFKDGAQSLPDSKTIENTFTMGIFEVEGVESVITGTEGVSDTVYDIKVLPDRAHYCYSHRYVAQELGALLNIPVTLPVSSEIITCVAPA